MKVIFNPYYSLKNDKNRILLANSQNFKIPREKADEGVMSFIHPLYAMFFSYFDGNHTFEETINRISLDFSEDINLIRNIISPFINNQSNVGFEYEGNIFEFPKKILVNAEEYKDFKKCKYNIEDFIITEDFDFKSSRLNTSPSEIRILVNTECATDCIYCYVDRKVKNSCKIPIERIIELIKESKKIGVTSFDIAGTEIFLYKYWSTLVEYLIKNDFYPYLSTKIPIGKKIIDCLVKIGIKDIQFSIDSLIESEVEIVNKFNTKDYSFRIKTESHDFTTRSPLVLALLTNVVSSFEKFMPPASVDDGYMRIVIFREYFIMDILRILPLILRGSIYTSKYVTILKVKKAYIELLENVPLPTNMDGNKGPYMPVDMEVLPGFLKVYVPAKKKKGLNLPKRVLKLLPNELHSK